jgi:hypothetical protein
MSIMGLNSSFIHEKLQPLHNGTNTKINLETYFLIGGMITILSEKSLLPL